jgi:hypothetical protein
MSNLTYQQATNDVYGDVKTAADSVSLQIYWEDVPKARDTDEDPYVYVNLRIDESGQATLGGTGKRQFERFGTLVMTIYSRQGQGLQSARSLATTLGNAFEGKKSVNGAWYRNVLVTPVGRDGLFQRYEIAVTFRFTEIK